MLGILLNYARIDLFDFKDLGELRNQNSLDFLFPLLQGKRKRGI